MKIILSHSSNVIDLYTQLDVTGINNLFKPILQTLSLKIENQKWQDWKLDFQCYCTPGEEIRVFKSTKPYVRDKQKLVVIHVPIPSNDVVSWGIRKEQFIPAFYPSGMEKFYTGLSVDFHVSTTLVNHVVWCLKTGISFAFSDGITILGEKVKIENVDILNR